MHIPDPVMSDHGVTRHQGSHPLSTSRAAITPLSEHNHVALLSPFQNILRRIRPLATTAADFRPKIRSLGPEPSSIASGRCLCYLLRVYQQRVNAASVFPGYMCDNLCTHSSTGDAEEVSTGCPIGFHLIIDGVALFV